MSKTIERSETVAHHNQINPRYIVVISTGPDRGNVPPRQEGRPMRRDEADSAAHYWAGKGYTAQVVEAFCENAAKTGEPQSESEVNWDRGCLGH